MDRASQSGTTSLDFDLSLPFVPQPEQARFGALQHQEDDEKELSKACLEDIADARQVLRHARSKKIMTKQDKKEKAEGMIDEEGIEVFADRIARALKAAGVQFPTVEIKYQNLTVEVDALVGNAGNPSVGNSFLSLFRKVTCQGGLKTRPLTILNGVNGVIKPGRLTLLLGPPGGGKTVLLQTLSGRMNPHKQLRIKGSVKYNGVSSDTFFVRRTAGLVDQRDYHIPNMTVLETVKFANDCQHSNEEAAVLLANIQHAEHQHEASTPGAPAIDASAAAHAASSAEDGVPMADDDMELLQIMKESVINRLKPYVTLRILGINDVADTFVGSAELRGVSGGQRKRVTTAEALAGPQWVLLMDEISTGLDSATTFSVVQSMLHVCHALQRTVVISLLQPPPEVMELFDDVILMTDAQIIYQ